ncbi:unnamed protein product [Urochloa humidicola]
MGTREQAVLLPHPCRPYPRRIRQYRAGARAGTLTAAARRVLEERRRRAKGMGLDAGRRLGRPLEARGAPEVRAGAPHGMRPDGATEPRRQPRGSLSCTSA